MSHTSIILTGLMTMALLVFFAPNIFALNRGHILRNIALWLAIFLGLALFYQTFGPDGQYPLFQLPESMSGLNQGAPKLVPPPVKKDESTPETGELGFTPPKE